MYIDELSTAESTNEVRREKGFRMVEYVHLKKPRRKIVIYITRRFRLLHESPDDRTARLPDELVHST